MTNTQFYAVIIIPIIFNFGMFGLFFTLINSNINTRISDLREDIDRRLRNIENEIKDLRKELFTPKQRAN